MCDSTMSCQTLCASSITDLVDTENTPYYVDRWNFLASFPQIDIFAFSLFTSTPFQSLLPFEKLIHPPGWSLPVPRELLWRAIVSLWKTTTIKTLNYSQKKTMRKTRNLDFLNVYSCLLSCFSHSQSLRQ